MPTMPHTATAHLSLSAGSGGGQDGSQLGPAPPGSVHCPQPLAVSVDEPSTVWSSDDGCPPDPASPDPGCCTSSCGCQTCDPSGGAIEGLAWLQRSGGPAGVNPANGNLVFRFGMPRGGAFSPNACCWYNSQDTNSAEFGYGARNGLRKWLEEASGTAADLYEGDGSVLHYTNLNGMTGEYTPPDGVTSKLTKSISMPTKWTQTRPDGFKYEYDASGDLVKMQNAAARSGR